MAANGRNKGKGQKDPYLPIRCSNTQYCTGYLYSPIFSCPSEHNLCTTCVSFFQMKCPMCQGAVSYERVLKLEELAQTLLTPCAFRNRGCHFQFPLQEIVQHQQVCTFGVKTCFSAKCGWNGTVEELVQHMESMHKERVYHEPEVTFSTRRISSRKEGVDTVSFITCDAGNFWVRFQFAEDEEQFYGAVQYIGCAQEAEKIVCEIEMLEKDDDGELTGLKCLYTGKVFTEADSFDDIFDNEQCFTVCLDFAKYFEYDDVLRVVVRVKKPY